MALPRFYALFQGSYWFEFKDKTEELVDSTVTREGKVCIDPSFRRSKTSTKTYDKIDCGHEFQNLFESFRLGPFKKHVYSPGDFMKEHTDMKMSDDHIGTVIVTNSVKEIRVNGSVPNDDHIQWDISCVLFMTLGVPHEVLPVETTRVSFCAPVFGVLGKKKDRYPWNKSLQKAVEDAIQEILAERDDVWIKLALYAISLAPTEVLSGKMKNVLDKMNQPFDVMDDFIAALNGFPDENDPEQFKEDFWIKIIRRFVEMRENYHNEKKFSSNEIDEMIQDQDCFKLFLTGLYTSKEISIDQLDPFDTQIREYLEKKGYFVSLGYARRWASNSSDPTECGYQHIDREIRTLSDFSFSYQDSPGLWGIDVESAVPYFLCAKTLK